MKALLYWAYLRPIILADYRRRMAGLAPDKMHWADLKAIGLGFWTDLPA